MQYRKDRNGNELSILGYGCMRFTRKGGGIDIDKAERALRPLPYMIAISAARAFMFRKASR